MLTGRFDACGRQIHPEMVIICRFAGNFRAKTASNHETGAQRSNDRPPYPRNPGVSSPHSSEAGADDGSGIGWADVIELKQILLNRIAELEALSALLPPNDEPKQEAAKLPPLAAVTETEPVKEPADAHPLEKLD